MITNPLVIKSKNRGHEFEERTIIDLYDYFNGKKIPYIKALVTAMNRSNPKFKPQNVVEVHFRTGSTRKRDIHISNLGEVIGDVLLIDKDKEKWYISLKDRSGNTFSSYPGASTLFNSAGDIQPKSQAGQFLNVFGVDLNQIQAGFDERRHIKKDRKPIKIDTFGPIKAMKLFQQAWGMNYFYARQMKTNEWHAFWMNRSKLNSLSTGLRVTSITYPSSNSKQITIFCENSLQRYIIEMRNSHGGEYPNDIKFKVRN